MVLIFQAALAIDCLGLDPDSCAASTQIEAQLSNQSPGVLHGPSARLTPTGVYDAVERIRSQLDGICTPMNLVLMEATHAGVYGRRRTSGEWSDADGSGTESGRYSAGTFYGTFTGDRSGSYGAPFGVYAGMRFVSSYDGGFFAGEYVRTAGKRGVYLAVSGHCAEDAAELFDTWYPGGLGPFLPPDDDGDGFDVTEDCDDNDPDAFPGAIWFADGDGDQYGDPGSGTTSCLPPHGHVANDDDCDDGNADLNPDTPWYPDDDGDGLGGPTPVSACLQPAGHVSNDDDCDDGDGSVMGPTTRWRDSDEDGAGADNGAPWCAWSLGG